MLRIYSVVLQVIRDLRPLIETLDRHDPDLARQCKRALVSVPLNIAEGSHSQGRNRNARYHNALGSMREARACFETAIAFGYMNDLDPQVGRSFDQVIGTLVCVVGSNR